MYLVYTISTRSVIALLYHGYRNMSYTCTCVWINWINAISIWYHWHVISIFGFYLWTIARFGSDRWQTFACRYCICCAIKWCNDAEWYPVERLRMMEIDFVRLLPVDRDNAYSIHTACIIKWHCLCTSRIVFNGSTYLMYPFRFVGFSKMQWLRRISFHWLSLIHRVYSTYMGRRPFF